MNVLTIPRKITHGKDLVVIPREEYEKFLRLLKPTKKSAVEAAIEEGLQDLGAGRVTPSFSSVKEFKQYLKKK